LDDDHSVLYEIECPTDYRELPGLAHTSWTAGIMSEICGQSPLWLSVVAFTGTVTTRYQAAVPVGERLIGRVTFEGREGRKIFVNATLTSSATGVELATAKTIMIAAEIRNLEERGMNPTTP
jgi:acyl dehydratase